MLFSFLVKGQSVFNNYYPSGSLSSAFRVQNVNTSDFLVSSYYKDNVTGQQGLDLRLLDNNGNSQLHKTFLFGSIDFLSFGNKKVQCNISNSTMLLTGGSYTGTMSTVIFTSVNKTTLDTNWSKTYKDGFLNYYISHVFKIKPNEVWFMGTRGNNTGYDTRPVIFKTDTMGNILSIKEFTTMINYEARQIYYDTLSNKFYIGGENYNNAPVPGTYYVTCVDTTGFINWNQQICNSPYDLFLYQIKRIGNTLICSGSIKFSNILSFGEHKLNLIKLNVTNGVTIWNKRYGKEYLSNSLTDFFDQPDGSIICTGSYSDKPINLSSNHDACLLKVNSNGDSLWMKTYSNYGQGVQEYMYDLQSTPDGGYIMCGAPNYANSTQAWVVKTDSVGVAPGMVITGLDEGKNTTVNFEIYPNPANDILNVDFEKTLQFQNPTIEIKTILGQVIIKNKFEKAIDVSSLKKGIYFLQIFEGEKLMATKKIIKE